MKNKKYLVCFMWGAILARDFSTVPIDTVKKLFDNFTILDMKKAHIFSWDIPKYITYQYEKESCFKNISDDFFKELESELGWHILIKAKKKTS